MIDQARIESAIIEILQAIGQDPDREGLQETPHRIARMYAEIFAGQLCDPLDELRVGFEEGHQELVMVKDVPFYSMCEHHLLPFHGTVHLGYIPNGRVVGISKLARVVDVLAKRPQLQERLTSQIADCLMEGLAPRGVAVVVEAEHLCMGMRGVKKPGARVTTSANRGIFRDSPATRAEFFSLIRQS